MFVVFVILLHVSQQVSALEVFEEDQFIQLPCQFHTFELTKPTVEWIRQDLSPSTVHQRQSEGDQLSDQNQFYRGRTSMKSDALETGDLSLNLTKLQQSDSGTYTCTIRDFREERTVTDVPLLVKRRFPVWVVPLLVILVLLVTAGLLFYYRQYFMSDYQVELDYGVDSVLLPCKTMVRLPGDVKVEWRDGDDRLVHLYENGSDQLKDQDNFYKVRTTMMKKTVQSGDLSLTLKHPTDEDTNTFTCKVYGKEGKVLMKKQATLRIRGTQRRLLPCV